MASSIGNLFRLTTFGESHGPAMGGVLDGCPSGLKINFDDGIIISFFLNTAPILIFSGRFEFLSS